MNMISHVMVNNRYLMSWSKSLTYSISFFFFGTWVPSTSSRVPDRIISSRAHDDEGVKDGPSRMSLRLLCHRFLCLERG